MAVDHELATNRKAQRDLMCIIEKMNKHKMIVKPTCILVFIPENQGAYCGFLFMFSSRRLVFGGKFMF